MRMESKMSYVLNGLLITVNLYFVWTIGPDAWLNVLAIGFVLGVIASRIMRDLIMKERE